MSYTTRYRLVNALLVVGIVVLASLLGAAIVYGQDPGVDIPASGIPGGQVTIYGALISAIVFLAKRLESRPTSETLSRAYAELDAGKAEITRLRDSLDEERTARVRAELRLEMLGRASGGG